MKKYTEPKFEIVTVEASDVITASFRTLFTAVRNGLGVEGSGRASLSDYVTSSAPTANS